MQITDANDEVWEVEDLKLYYDPEGYIQYGYQANGFFVVSGQNGPEAKGWPGVTLKPGLHVLRSKLGHIRPVTDEEYATLSGTKEFTPQPVKAPPPPDLRPSYSHSEPEKEKSTKK